MCSYRGRSNSQLSGQALEITAIDDGSSVALGGDALRGDPVLLGGGVGIGDLDQ